MNFLKRFKYLIIIAVIVLGAILYFSFKPGEAPRVDTIVAEKVDLIQEVSVVGNVKPAKSVDLAFEVGGKVKIVNADVGAEVKKDQVLAELDNSDAQTEVTQANAQVSSARATLEQYRAVLAADQAKLDEMKSGTRPEEIKIAQTKIDNTKSALENAKIDLENEKQEAQTDLANLYDDVVNILNDAYTKSDDAVNKQLNDLFSEATNPEFSFEPNNSQLEVDSLTARRGSIDALAVLRSKIDSLEGSSNSEFDEALSVGEVELSIVRNFLNLISDILKGDTNLSSTNLATYRTNLNTARTNVNTALTNISNQQQLISTQKNTNQDSINTAESIVDTKEFDLQTAEDELALKLAGYTKEQISAQEAKVLQARANIKSQEAMINQKIANVEKAKVQLEKTIIKSPIDGVVTRQDAKEGEIVNAQTPMVAVISAAEFELETNIPEVDISKIKIGNIASITLDAYGEDEKFEAVVMMIDPAEETIEGVSTYKVTLQFVEANGRIRSGMTADIEILTNEKENIIAIPQRAIINKSGKKIVRIIKNGSVEEVEVKTGMRGSDGRIEIISGISEGQTVVTFME
jgi:HlyD family secretion protein